MTVTVDVLDPRRDPEPPDWAAFAEAQRLPVPWDYGLLTIETTGSRSPNILVLVRENSRVTAAFGVTICRRGTEHRFRAVGGTARFAPRWAEVHQQWLSGYPGWAFAETVGIDARPEIVRLFERAICRYVGPGCVGVLYRSVSPAEEYAVSGRGRIVRDAAPTSVLDNTFESREQWISSLSRSRRHSIRGQIRKISGDPSLTIRGGTGRDDLDGAELAPMLDAHRAKFGRVAFDFRGAITPAYLHALVRRQDVFTVTYHDDSGRLLAFTNVLDHPVLPLHQHWAAVPVEDGGRQHLYFDAFARVAGHMIDAGRKGMSSGRGLSELKSSLGFTARPLRAVIAPRPVCG
ncbi:GNAT family N-acetyltransferase [Amycolatopsis antarctica]|uniref:GNAT family N-acetyltransferase n=1 Tax=Amycolatopsis antarctica TaxID=1854586 RepID=A0A263DAN0_9PSEU|nr:GNAT family N-acetyltransferase [Amycolatopsis antarctica]OZM75038.1 GNAT family N-acetyltransferase [Amycolatopsis antarctica]